APSFTVWLRACTHLARGRPVPCDQRGSHRTGKRSPLRVRSRQKRGPRQRGPRREHPMLRLVSAGDQPQVVGAQYFVDRLEVRGATEGAVTGATGGHALSLVARDERATRVTRLGADVGAGQTGDGALRVTHGLVEGLDLAAVPAG